MNTKNEKAKPAIKTPISYYGGKQLMLPHLLPVIPEHKIYVESFFGGGALYWAKQPSYAEVINDVNANIVNFYEVLKHGFFDLRKKVEATLHSRETYKKAMIIYDCPWLFDEVVRAWAFWVVTNQGFACQVGTWGYDRGKGCVGKHLNKIDAFQEVLTERLSNTQIEQNEAHKVILSRDTESTFHYVDPPYVGSNQGHYGGYTLEHFEKLLETLSSIKGKFVLSTYPNEMLEDYSTKNGWFMKSFEKTLSASNGAKVSKRKTKIEVITSNFEMNSEN
ncbi:MAG: DNA adenine methylase [Bacteroidetes bacterium]|nr:DNA adenine methylase [Bacteroidota bacterium]